MPQLAKGGKNVFGWSVVGDEGMITIPPDAYREYGFKEGEEAVLITGSRSSGGFSLARKSSLGGSPLGRKTRPGPGTAEGGSRPPGVGKVGSPVRIRNGKFSVPLPELRKLGVLPGSPLLTVRGSWMGLGFIVRGPIVEEAKKHPELITV